MERHAEQIMRAGAAAGKTYAYNENHPRCQPAQWWFQDSQEGLVLFVVFYTQACRWSSCLGCSLPSKSSRYHVGFRDLIAQVDYLFGLPGISERLGEVRKIIVSNNGSVLDEDTFSSTALMYLLARIRLWIPGLQTISMETRPEYVDREELEFLKRALREEGAGIGLELAIGFEAFDDGVRNEVFRKGLELDQFERFIALVAPFRFSVKCYFMQKPVPDMSDAEAVLDIEQAIDYLDGISRRCGISINMHLNPTYVASGTPLEACFNRGLYQPPLLSDVARAALHAKGKNVSVFLGLYDEGLAVSGGSFIRAGDQPLIEQLEAFNRTQDYRLLEAGFDSGSGIRATGD